jgi:hypothetical protein
MWESRGRCTVSEIKEQICGIDWTLRPPSVTHLITGRSLRVAILQAMTLPSFELTRMPEMKSFSNPE